MCQPSLYLLAEKRQFVKDSFSNATIRIDECDVGLGVFANRDIQAGEAILAFGGPVIDFAETKRRGPWECMPMQIGRNQYYDTQPPGVFVNHSCDPNAGIRDDRELVALRAIPAGEDPVRLLDDDGGAFVHDAVPVRLSEVPARGGRFLDPPGRDAGAVCRATGGDEFHSA